MVPVRLKRGETFGVDALKSACVPASNWYTEKPVAPGSRACVAGRNPPIGLAGDEIVCPKYAPRSPLVKSVALNSVALPVAAPVIA